MSKRDIAIFLFGIICGGVVVGRCMLTMTALHNIEAVGTKPDATHPTNRSSAPATEKLSYAFEGCCAVTLVEQWQWKLGNYHYSETREDQIFLFAGPDELSRFQEAPDRYTPAFSGNDVVLAKENGKTASGKREHGLKHEDRIYLFANEESLQRFALDPALYLADKDDKSIHSVAKVVTDSNR